MPGHERVHLFLPYGHVIDVHDDDGRMIHNFGELTEQQDGSFVLTIMPSDFEAPRVPYKCPGCGESTCLFDCQT